MVSLWFGETQDGHRRRCRETEEEGRRYARDMAQAVRRVERGGGDIDASSRERLGGLALVALDGEGDVELFLGEIPFGLGDLERQIFGRGRRARHGDCDRGPQSHAQSRHTASGSWM